MCMCDEFDASRGDEQDEDPFTCMWQEAECSLNAEGKPDLLAWNKRTGN